MYSMLFLLYSIVITCITYRFVHVCVPKLYICLTTFVSPLHSQTDRLFALSRLKQSGAFLTTTEAVMLQLVPDAKHPNFKQVLTAAAFWVTFVCLDVL